MKSSLSIDKSTMKLFQGEFKKIRKFYTLKQIYTKITKVGQNFQHRGFQEIPVAICQSERAFASI